jgi:hypothetical protein
MKFLFFIAFLIFAKILCEIAGDDTLVDSLVNGEQENLIDVRLKFEGKELELSFPRTKAAALHMASKFCHDRLDEDDSRMKDCIRPIGEYLVKEVEKEEKRIMVDTEIASRNVSVTVEIASKRYDISMNPMVETSEAAAELFCLQNHESLGVNINDIDRYCIPPIKAKIDEAVVSNSVGKKKAPPLKDRNERPTKKEKSKAKSSNLVKKVTFLNVCLWFPFISVLDYS